MKINIYSNKNHFHLKLINITIGKNNIYLNKNNIYLSENNFHLTIKHSYNIK